jgi:uncharacterized protein YegL
MKTLHKYMFLLVLPAFSSSFIGCGKEVPQKYSPYTNNSSGDPSRSSPREQLLQDVQAGTAAANRCYYFVLDGSGSMAGDKIDGLKSAVEQFLQTVPEDVWLGLYIFDSNGSREVLGLAPHNRDNFLKQTKGMDASGGTPLGGAIKQGINSLLDQFKKQLGYGWFDLVVVTDGEASDGDELEEAVAYANQYSVPIHTIGFKLGGQHSLRKLADSYRDADDEEGLRRGLSDILAESEEFETPSYEEDR